MILRMRLDLWRDRFCQAAEMSELMSSKCCFNLSKGQGALTHNTETTDGWGERHVLQYSVVAKQQQQPQSLWTMTGTFYYFAQTQFLLPPLTFVVQQCEGTCKVSPGRPQADLLTGIC